MLVVGAPENKEVANGVVGFANRFDVGFASTIGWSCVCFALKGLD